MAKKKTMTQNDLDLLGVNEEMVIEPGNDGRDYIGLTVPNVEEPIFVAFRDEMWQFHKVLVILPY